MSGAWPGAAGAPADLVQVVTGYAEAGAALVSGGVDKLIFVGSTEARPCRPPPSHGCCCWVALAPHDLSNRRHRSGVAISLTVRHGLLASRPAGVASSPPIYSTKVWSKCLLDLS